MQKLDRRFKFVILITALLFLGCQKDNQEKEVLIQEKAPIYQFNNDDPLKYLNKIRQDVGLKELSLNDQLNRAAYNHANYLTIHKIISHDESPLNKYFSGVTQSDRAINAGYNSRVVVENISYNTSYKNSIDSLMSAIYHRFGFLEIGIDEIGMGEYKDGNFGNYVFDMGYSKLDERCLQGNSINSGYLAINVCKNMNIKIPMDYVQNILHPMYKLYTTFPMNLPSLAYFSGEIPDPVPECKILSNPVSITFNDNRKIEFVKFEIFKDGSKIEHTKLITAQNDVNRKFKQNQYALFSYEPFEFGKEYEAKFTYKMNGMQEHINWNFTTMTPKYPYFDAKNKDRLSIKNDQTYDIFFRPKDCNDIMGTYEITTTDIISKKIEFVSANMLRVTLNGYKSGKAIFLYNGKTITLILSNGDEKYPMKKKTLFGLALLIAILAFYLLRPNKA